jgi:hypothetical protein
MFINCTPHELSVYSMDGKTKVLFLQAPFSGASIPRVKAETSIVSVHGLVELTHTTYGEVSGLPPYIPGVYLVVSGMVRSALPTRLDLVSPGELVRDMMGCPIGCKGLVVNT